MLYLLSPLMFAVMKKSKLLLAAVGIVLPVCLCLLLGGSEFNYLVIFVSRIPIFTLGIMFGLFAEKDKKPGKLGFTILISMFIAGLAFLFYCIKFINFNLLWNYGFYWFAFILIAPSVCILLSFLLSKITTRKIKILAFFGTYSLEIYLFHERIINIYKLVANHFDLTINAVISNLICAAAACICAVIFHNIIKIITTRKKSIPTGT